MNAIQTLTCSHCGELRTEGRFHDSHRCWTIAHAYATTREGNPTEADHHIVELVRWLADHPYASSPQARQAKADRLQSLERWIAKAQLIAAK
jgi:hypothetical protein